MGENLALVLFLLIPCVTGVLLALFARYLRARKAPTGWLRLSLGNLLVFLSIIGQLFLAGEVYYRFIYDTTDALDSTKVSERWFRRYYHMNSGGCRDNLDYQARIQPGKRRITILGDSFTVGHGIKNVENRFANL